MIFISNCSANSSQGRLLNIGAELFRQQVIEKSNFEVGKFVTSDLYLYNKDFVDSQLEWYGNVHIHPFVIRMAEGPSVLIEPMTNAEGYIECIAIFGLRSRPIDQLVVNEAAVKIVQIMGLSVEEMKTLFLQGQEFQKLYLGQVYSAQLGRNVYLGRINNQDGVLYIIDYKKLDERSSTLGKMFKLQK